MYSAHLVTADIPTSHAISIIGALSWRVEQGEEASSSLVLRAKSVADERRSVTECDQSVTSVRLQYSMYFHSIFAFPPSPLMLARHVASPSLLIEADSEPRADIRTILYEFDIQAGELNDRDMSPASATSVGTSRAAALAMPVTSAVKSGISSYSDAAAATGLPGWPDCLDWQDINGISSLMPPELTGTTLMDPLDIDVLDESTPTTAKIQLQCPDDGPHSGRTVRASPAPMPTLALELADSLPK
ncbi:hypothetical protein Asppvi_001779 [Aspergillus pseudoviridinutans]|uniref:Uncharacterized protein n=1 Tax=Aspergillus pseudoviridinutans TaxID=1517512 RepID=A0A9P3EXZ6_9EURO|nr:uncharacterized protein Asppvi_001779 [Aspergillus pseudoviridinutans]GIJ92501.1 hypothetical protein Asppvi_001779 [Aspergillus pseudoviridinutans]